MIKIHKMTKYKNDNIAVYGIHVLKLYRITRLKTRTDRMPVTSGDSLFHVAAARYRKARWVQTSRHRGSSRRPASVERVERWETADRATNIDRTAGGQSFWVRSLCILTASFISTNRPTRSHPRARSVGPILSVRRAPVTTRAAKLMVFWVLKSWVLLAPPQTERQ